MGVRWEVAAVARKVDLGRVLMALLLAVGRPTAPGVPALAR